MLCFKCKEEMSLVREKNNDYEKYRLFQCDICESYGHIYYHVNTEDIKTVEWDEAEK